MRKLMIMFACLFMAISGAMADNDKIIQFGQLPAQAKVFITSNFKSLKVAVAKVEKEKFNKTYEVIFTTGEKVEFNKNGVWLEVECGENPVPKQIIPAEIKRYLRKNYSGLYVKAIEHEKKGYSIELSNGLEIEFDNAFNVVDIDD